jgi:hypothetical protein
MKNRTTHPAEFAGWRPSMVDAGSSCCEACHDCIEIHGDTHQEWLQDWPEGAEYRSDYHTHLCDGCYEERREHEHCASESDPTIYDYPL